MSFCLTKLKSSEHSGFQSSGWFEKEGRFFRVKTKRFLRLQGPFLSNHTSEDDPAIWCVNLRETPVTARRQDNGKNLLIIELHRGTESFVAEDEDVFEKGFKIMLPRAADNVRPPARRLSAANTFAFSACLFPPLSLCVCPSPHISLLGLERG